MMNKIKPCFNYRWLKAIGVFLAFIFSCHLTIKAQISNYTFSQTFEPYETLTMDSTMGTATTDDQNFNGIRIGFPFTFNNVVYTQVSINFNGFVVMGPISRYGFTDACVSVANASGRALNSTSANSTNNHATAFNMDLQATGYSSFGIKRIGTAPNRVFIVQWANVRRYASSAGSDSINFQVRLYETTNMVEYRYGRCRLFQDQAVPLLVQVGLRGNSAAEFAARRSDDNWSATTAATSNTDGVRFSPTISPTPGLIFRYTPLPPAENDLAMVAVLSPVATTEGCTLSNDEKVRVVIRNNGTQGQTSLPVGYRVNNGTVVTQTFTRATPLPFGGLDTLTFTQGANLSTTGTYRIVAFTRLANELPLSRANDTISNYTVTLTPARDLPQPIVTSLAVGNQAGWRQGRGKNKPSGNTGGWTTAFPFASETIALTSANNSGNIQDWYYSPNINISNFSVLIFKAAMTADAFGSSPVSNIGDDTIKVMVSFNCGDSWQVLKNFKQSDLTGDTINNTLREFRFKLTNATSAKAIIAFYFTNNNTPAANTYRFHLDDIEIREIPPFDAGVVAVLRPRAASPGCVLSTQETVTAVIRNYGSSSFSNLSVGYTVNGGAPVIQAFTLAQPLQPNRQDTVTFSAANGANMSQAGTYTFNAFTILPGEIPITRANDTLKNYRVRLSAPFSIPSPLYSTLSQMTSGSWKRGRGLTAPTQDTVSNWLASNAMGGIETISVLATTAATPLREWIISPTYAYVPDAVLVCRIAVTRGNTTALPNANMGDDTLKLMYTTDCGASWQLIRRFSQADIQAGVIKDSLRRFVFPLNVNSDKIAVAFFFNNNGTAAVSTYRVHIKDVQIRTPLLPNDLGVTAILAPVNNIAFCTLGTGVPVRVVVTNFGTNPQTSSAVAYRLGNGPETVINATFTPSPLLPGNSDTITFSGASGINLTNYGNFNLKAYTKLANETPGGNINDTLQGYFIDMRAPLTGTAFVEFFDNSTSLPTGWNPERKPIAAQQFAVKADRGFGNSNAMSVALTLANPQAFVNSPRYLIPGNLMGLRFKYRISTGIGDPIILRGNDSIIVSYTTNCGQSFNKFIRIDSSNHPLTNQFIDTLAILNGFAGQELMFSISARIGRTDTSRANFDLDNWIIETVTENLDVLSASELTLYPNPASNTVQVVSKWPIHQVNLLDIRGSVVKRMTAHADEKQVQVNIADLKPGVYVLQCHTSQGTQHRKLMIHR